MRALRALLRRRTIRFRLTLAYTALFAIAGVVLLAATYALVAHSLSATTLPNKGDSLPLDPQFAAYCKNATDQNLIDKCKAADFLNGVSVGSTAQRDRALSDLLRYSIIGLLAMVCISALIGRIVAGRALRPIQAITWAARTASETNLHQRINLTGPRDELTQLADTFDAMLARLDAAFSSQRRFVADASHELRTPLTVMRTAVDVTLAKPDRSHEQLEHMAAEIRKAVDSAEELIDALLALATSDRGALVSEPVDLAVVAEDAIDEAMGAIASAGLHCDSWLDPAMAVGNQVLLERVVGNLIVNAVKYNEPGGWIRVATGSRDGSAYVTLSNSGPLVPAELAAGLCEPFRRLNGRSADGTGVGLGLAIVRSVTAAHKGELRVTSRPTGGLDVSVLVPQPLWS